MSTITTRSGKGAPLTNNEVDSNFTNLNTDKAELSGATFTGDVKLGDNDKATFGAGDDLQIFHDGSNSYISEVGAGSLIIQARDAVTIEDGTSGDNYIYMQRNNKVELYHAGAAKLATTATGIDVTGRAVVDGLSSSASILGTSNSNSLGGTTFTSSISTVGLSSSAAITSTSNSNSLGGTSFTSNIDVTGTATMDGLVVDGSIQLTDSNSSNRNILYLDNSDNVILATGTTAGARGIDLYTNNKKSFAVAENGDISFYEDTGTTAKLFWDASAESLGIGTSTPSEKLELIHNGANRVRFSLSDTGNNLQFWNDNTPTFAAAIGTGNPTSTLLGTDGLKFDIYNGSWSEAMRIGSAGYVGIGESNPQELLHLTATTPVFRMQGGSRTYQQFVSGTSFTIRDVSAGLNRVTLDSAGNVLVGTTDSNVYNDATGTGTVIQSNGIMQLAANNGTPLYANRQGTDGTIVEFRKDGDPVGGISTEGNDLAIGNGDAGLQFINGTQSVRPFNITTNARLDNAIDLGMASTRFKDLYLSGTATATAVNTGAGAAGRNAFSSGDIRVAAPNDTNISLMTVSNTLATIKTDFYGGGSLVPLVLQTGTNTNQLYLDTAGKVGIGTSTPTQKLHVDSGEVLVKSAYDASGTTNSKIYFATRQSGNWRNSYIGNTGDDLTFATGGTGTTHTNATERMRIDSAGHAIIPNGVTLGTAVGVYNAANTLDDYEEGTWTPVVRDASTTGTVIAISSNNCTYTKVGKVVTITGQFTRNDATVLTNILVITGLPFAQSGGQQMGGSAWVDNSAGDVLGLTTGGDTTYMNLKSIVSPNDYIKSDQWANNRPIYFSRTYTTDS